jgi:hypothetical protein
MQSFHFLTEGFHLVTVLRGFFDADAADFEVFESTDFSLQVVREARLTLLLVLHHALLKGFEWRGSFDVLLFKEVMVDPAQLFVQRQHVAANVLGLAVT